LGILSGSSGANLTSISDLPPPRKFPEISGKNACLLSLARSVLLARGFLEKAVLPSTRCITEYDNKGFSMKSYLITLISQNRVIRTKMTNGAPSGRIFF